jgi:hypothetical protein
VIGALLMAMVIAQSPPAYPTALDVREIRRLIIAADDDFAGARVAREPDATRKALARHVERLLAECKRRGVAYEYAEAARRDIEAGPPVPYPGVPLPIDGRLAKLSIHARWLLKELDKHPAPEGRP